MKKYDFFSIKNNEHKSPRKYTVHLYSRKLWNFVRTCRRRTNRNRVLVNLAIKWKWWCWSSKYNTQIGIWSVGWNAMDSKTCFPIIKRTWKQFTQYMRYRIIHPSKVKMRRQKGQLPKIIIRIISRLFFILISWRPVFE